MTTTQTLVNQTTGCAASPRPEAVASPAYATAIAGGRGTGRIVGSWLATRKSMTVPAFHDRWPLCSST